MAKLMHHVLAHSFVLIAATSAFAQDVVGGIGTQSNQRVQLRSFILQTEITGRSATTTMSLVFVNYANSDQPAVFQWRSSPATAAFDLALWVEGRRCPAVLYPHAQAEAIYREIAERQRRDPALLEYLGDGLWNLRVFPIQAMKTRKVEVRFTELLPVDGNEVIYRAPLPTNASTATEAQEVDLTAHIRCPGGVKDMRALNRLLGVQRHKEGSVTVGWRGEHESLTKPIQLAFTPGKKPPEVVTWAPQDGRARCLALLVPPKGLVSAATQSRNVVIVLDASGSMKGESWRRASAAMRAIVEKLDANDGLTLVVAGAEPRFWKEGFQPATEKTREAALAFAESLRLAGGTDLAGALRAAESLAAGDRRVEIFLLSDGLEQMTVAPEPSMDEAVGKKSKPAAVTGRVLDYRVFAVGVNGWSLSMAELARRTGGTVLFATEPAAASAAGAALVERCRKARIENATVKPPSEWDPNFGSLDSVVHSLVKEGEGLAVAGVTGDWRNWTRLELAGEVDGRKLTEIRRLRLGADNDSRGAWTDEHAHRIYQHLVLDAKYRSFAIERADLSNVEELYASSRDAGIVTQGVALLVLESDKDYIARGIVRPASDLDVGRRLTEAEAEQKLPEDDIWDCKNTLARLKELLKSDDLGKVEELMGEIRFAEKWAPKAVLEAALIEEVVAIRRKADRKEEKAGGAFDDLPWHAILSGETPRQFVISAAVGDVNANPKLLPQERLMRRKLAREVEGKALEKANLARAAEWIEATWGVPVKVQWKQLAEAGVKTDAQVSVPGGKLTATAAIKAIIESAGKEKLAYDFDYDSLRIGSAKELPDLPVSKAYDVRALVARLPCYWTWGDGGGIGANGRRTYDVRDLTIGVGGGRGGGGIFGGGVYDDASTGGHAHAEGDFVRLGVEKTDVLSQIGAVGGVSVREGKCEFKPLPSGSDGGFPDADVYLYPRVSDWPTRSQLVFRIAEQLGMAIQIDEDANRMIVLHPDNGLIVARRKADEHAVIQRLLPNLHAKLEAGGFNDLYEGQYPESLYTPAGRIEKWLAELLAKAAAGKLSKHSSARVMELGGRKVASVGGVWFDTSLAGTESIYVVARESAAAEVLAKASPALAEWRKREEPVVLRVDAKNAICLDDTGIRDELDEHIERLAKLLAK